MIFYLSPHADDVAFSCAGSVALDVAAGHPVTLITVFLSGADAATRRREDEAAAASLGCTYRCLELPDAPERPEVHGALDVFMPFGPPHLGITNEVCSRLQWHISGPAEVRAPLGIGGHIDHRIVHEAARALAYQLGSTVSLSYYEDLPYALAAYSLARRLDALEVRGQRDEDAVIRAARLRADIATERSAYRNLFLSWPLLHAWLPGLSQLRGHVLAKKAVAADLRGQRPGFPPRLTPWLRSVESVREKRQQAIASYGSQWPQFATSLEAFLAAMDGYGQRVGGGALSERLWRDDGVYGRTA